MIALMVILLSATQAIIFQTRVGADAFVYTMFALSVCCVWCVWRNIDKFERLTFILILLINVTYLLAPKVDVSAFNVDTGIRVFGNVVKQLSWRTSDYRHAVVLTAFVVYVFCALRYTRAQIATQLRYVAVFTYTAILYCAVRGYTPELFVLQQRSFAAVLCAMLLPFSGFFWVAGVAAMVALHCETAYALLCACAVIYAPRHLRGAVAAAAAMAAAVVVWHTRATASIRVEIWRQAVAALSWRGVGAGAAVFVIGDNKTFFAHNAMMTLVVETGIIGAVVALLLCAMVYGTRRWRPRAANISLLLFAIASSWDDAWQMLAVAALCGVLLATTDDTRSTSASLTECIVRDQNARWRALVWDIIRRLKQWTEGLKISS